MAAVLSPADTGVHGSNPLQEAVRVARLQARGQQGGAGQVCQGVTADLRPVLRPIVTGQQGLQRGSAPYRMDSSGLWVIYRSLYM